MSDLKINRDQYLDDYGTQVDPLFDMVDDLKQELASTKEGLTFYKDLIDRCKDSDEVYDLLYEEPPKQEGESE